MENPRRHSGSSASRRLRYLLALAGDYLKYLFMKRRRLMHKVARRTLALVHRHGRAFLHVLRGRPRPLPELRLPKRRPQRPRHQQQRAHLP